LFALPEDRWKFSGTGNGVPGNKYPGQGTSTHFCKTFIDLPLSKRNAPVILTGADAEMTLT
jgi:hypothetical protein